MRKVLWVISFGFLVGCSDQMNKEQAKTKVLQLANAWDNPDDFVGEHKAKVTVLGVFHFNNPWVDDYKSKYTVDILSDERQTELSDLIESLSAYHPTKILIEVPRNEKDSIINEQYTRFLKGEYEINNKKSETYQLAFRLAKKLGHKKIFASDTEGLKWFGADIDWDNYSEEEHLKSLGQFEKSNRYDFDKMYEYQDSLKTAISLMEYLAYLNEPKNRLKDHQAYLTVTSLEGAGENYLGADAVARWYQRNIRIFANTYEITDFSEEERILLIYGAGHVWQLRQLLIDSPDFEYVEVNQYLR